jgi:hypothetical protein
MSDIALSPSGRAASILLNPGLLIVDSVVTITSMMHNVEVSVYSTEAAQDGVAEFRADGHLIAFTMLTDGELVVRFAPAPGPEPVLVNAHSLVAALLRAKELLT